jgi:hypothetical protein
VAGFFPHTGGSPSGYTALPQTTYATILDDIVADVTAQAGTNGWSVFDDQRSGYTPLVLPCNVAGLNWSQGITFTNGSQTISYGTYGRFKRSWLVGSAQVSTDQANWYTINALTNQTSGTLDRNFTGTGGAFHQAYEKSGPYIVLKCTSSQKTFYVLLARPVSIGISLRIQIFETWNASTHVGSNGGPMEELRAWEDGTGGTTALPLQYMLFLLPDVFGLWCGSPGAGGQSDFFYAGNLNPLRVGDGTCLLQACSNQDLSGIYPSLSPAYNSGGSAIGGASVFRNLAGALWVPPTTNGSYALSNNYIIYPRGFYYAFGVDRTNLDDAAKFQFCEMDAYWGGASGAGFDKNEGKRGQLRYLMCPVMNPSGLHLASLGPADDGNVYVLFRTTYPQQVQSGIASYSTQDAIYNAAAASGFAFSSRTGNLGEVYANNSTTGAFTRWFMMPTNL